jgi:hypothetical protein
MAALPFADEVVRLHRLFEAWFSGSDDVVLGDFTDSLADHFSIVSPAGLVLDRNGIVGAVVGSRGSGPVDISIENAKIRIDGRLTVGSYEEHQLRDGVRTARLATVVMEVEQTAPGGWLWHIVHETWLPGGAPDQARTSLSK